MNLAGFRVDISVRDLALAVSVSKATVETAVKRLMVAGLICQDGRDSGTECYRARRSGLGSCPAGTGRGADIRRRVGHLGEPPAKPRDPGEHRLRDADQTSTFVRLDLNTAAPIERQWTRGAQNISIAARASGRLLTSGWPGFPPGPTAVSFRFVPVL